MEDFMEGLINLLSVVTIVMCGFQNVPQIMRIIKVESSEGISKLSLFMGLFSYTTMASYNFLNGYKLISYFEYPLLISQQLVLIALVLYFSAQPFTTLAGIFVAYTAFVTSVMFKLLPSSILGLFVSLATPVSLSSKAIQLKDILVTRNVESISIYSWLMSSFTNASKFT
uniref:PQ-loop repeat-containing protein 3 n=1 Tax=Cacopsylla melanoneura TaxID=428564 RepID=A0A8D8LFP4_9HEMI